MHMKYQYVCFLLSLRPRVWIKWLPNIIRKRVAICGYFICYFSRSRLALGKAMYNYFLAYNKYISTANTTTYIHMARSCSHDGSWELSGKVFGTNTSPTAPTPPSVTRPLLITGVLSSPFTNLLLSGIVGTAKSGLSSFRKFAFPSATTFNTTNGKICTHIFYKFE